MTLSRFVAIGMPVMALAAAIFFLVSVNAMKTALLMGAVEDGDLF